MRKPASGQVFSVVHGCRNGERTSYRRKKLSFACFREFEKVVEYYCLKELVKQYPNLENEIFDKKGKLLSVLEIYLNGASAYPDEVAREVKDGDEMQFRFNV